MSTRLRTYVDTLFDSAPTTPRVYDLKEELLANLEEKYEDLRAAGHSDEDAYASVISGLGDAESLIASLSIEPEPHDVTYEDARRQTAQTVASSAFLFCIAIAAFLLVRMVLGSTLGWVAFWVIAGFAVGQTVYHYMTRPTSTHRPLSEQSLKQRKRVFGLISSTLWMATTAIYFLYSFRFGNWHLSWIIFLIATVLQNILALFFKMSDDDDKK